MVGAIYRLTLGMIIKADSDYRAQMFETIKSSFIAEISSNIANE